MQNCTIEKIRSLIPSEIAGMAGAMGDDWCHPQQLRLIRKWADSIVEHLTPESDPKGYAANLKLDDQPDSVLEKWGEMTHSAIVAVRNADAECQKELSALNHLIYLVADNICRNWQFFEAPKLLVT